MALVKRKELGNIIDDYHGVNYSSQEMCTAALKTIGKRNTARTISLVAANGLGRRGNHTKLERALKTAGLWDRVVALPSKGNPSHANKSTIYSYLLLPKVRRKLVVKGSMREYTHCCGINAFTLGKPGTGKNTFMQAIKDWTENKYAFKDPKNPNTRKCLGKAWTYVICHNHAQARAVCSTVSRNKLGETVIVRPYKDPDAATIVAWNSGGSELFEFLKKKKKKEGWKVFQRLDAVYYQTLY